MIIEIMPIENVFGLDNCYITKSGEIFHRLPTNGNRKRIDGCETITRNFSTYKIEDLINKAFNN